MMKMIWIMLFFAISLAGVSSQSQPFDYPTANLSTSWINSLSANHSVSFTDNSTVRSILLRGSFGPRYACGFYCNGACDSYLFAVFIVQTNSGGYITMPSIGFPQVVWSANRHYPVGINATLRLTAEGDLALRDADGKLAWSTNTAGKGVSGLNLTELGNLVLFDKNNLVVWQSFDHPTDCLVPGQILASGNHLTESASSTNWTEGGLFSVSMTGEGLVAFMQLDPQQNDATPSTDVEVFPTAAGGKKSLLGPILGSTIGIFVAVALIGAVVLVYRRRKRKTEDVEEDYLDHVPGMPTRFSYEELESATDNFSKKLGEGGFGSVYEGSLSDGTRIAVKRLDGVGHIRKSFLAEVETIGSIHHINLVRLVGFCADKSHRLLVYEYMCNGSLEKWIYNRNHEMYLDWNNRRKIILDVAKGLAYLHEDCRQKILHLDIKPQNILLDEHYNARLADFGLSKLIDRNQSQVVTTMRGTPGYLAPEWLNAIITEKVDVYSFGVVVLEILTGRKIFEQSRPEDERHLLTVFKKKAEDGQWLELVDKCCQDEECNLKEVDKMMQISAWCLQSDHENRPSMSMVVKVMEGAKDVQKDIDYNFLIPRYLISKTPDTSSSKDVTPLLPSLLSGPR